MTATSLTPTRWLAVITWLVVIVALEWYEVGNLATWPHVGRLAAIVIGVVAGFILTRRRWWLGALPLLGFMVGGYLLSTQFSSTQGYGGGDWSVAAVVIVGGIANGLIATLVMLTTLFARDGLRAIGHRLTRHAPARHAAR